MDGRNFHPAGGVDRSVDQVKRRTAFVKRHPEVSVLLPREAARAGYGEDEFYAVWSEPRDGVVVIATHEELRFLLDYLEARFDNSTTNRGAS